MRSQRRSLQSRKRAAKMKKMFGLNEGGGQVTQQDLIVRATSTSPTRPLTTPEVTEADDLLHPLSNNRDGNLSHNMKGEVSTNGQTTYRTQGTQDEPGDAEASSLYEWTKELNIDDINNIGRYSTMYSRQSTLSSYTSPTKYSPVKRKGVS